MEAKLSHNPEIPTLKSRLLRPSSSYPTFPPLRRLFFESLGEKKVLLIKRFQGLAEKWELQVQQRFKGGQHSTNQFLVHVVKEGETLTSISRRYNVSIRAIVAVNANIVDVDLVLEGQRLKIPPSSALDTLMGPTFKSWSYLIDANRRCQSSFNILGGHGNHKIFSMLSPHHLLHAKTAGYFLLLVPIVAVCVRLIIGAFHHSISKILKPQGVNEPEKRNFGSRSIRWKSALRDIREPEVSDAKSNQEFDSHPEDQSEVPFEDISHAYTELEPAYQKFLLECGISETGYWRGGSSK